MVKITGFALKDYDISLHMLIVFYIVIENPDTKTSKFIVASSDLIGKK